MGKPWRPDALTLSQRTALTQENEAYRRVERRRLPCHAWVDDDPALLLSWQQIEGTWWGQVVVATDDRAELALIRADRLRPA